MAAVYTARGSKKRDGLRMGSNLRSLHPKEKNWGPSFPAHQILLRETFAKWIANLFPSEASPYIYPKHASRSASVRWLVEHPHCGHHQISMADITVDDAQSVPLEGMIDHVPKAWTVTDHVRNVRYASMLHFQPFLAFFF